MLIKYFMIIKRMFGKGTKAHLYVFEVTTPKHCDFAVKIRMGIGIE